jgi:hypothetical protein
MTFLQEVEKRQLKILNYNFFDNLLYNSKVFFKFGLDAFVLQIAMMMDGDYL